ncbi:MAG: hypothetical protein JJ901_09205 [Erythrobacter sp.]|uniref:hypothetical protein n=1 Tax=Erythrobacter sp. TaxID=1042 RepID=UPI001B24043F|nr:hypothetical protein [Erythrobacter sp.]MBO6768460.1 hypothetical protein [Erythrobacter sp.]
MLGKLSGDPMRTIASNSAVSAAAVVLGLWIESSVMALTGADGAKLVIGRLVIWGSLACAVAGWIFRDRVAAMLSRVAERLESRQVAALDRIARASSTERTLNALFVLSALLLTVFAMLDAQAFTVLFYEDGPFEYGSAILYGIASASCLVLAARASGRTRLRSWLIGLALLFLFVGGEEISWGQRLFGFDTPEELAAINVQGEFTLHNVYSNSLFVYPGLAVTAALLFVLPLLHAHQPLCRRLLDALEFPVASVSCAWLFGLSVVCYGIVGLTLGSPTPLPINWSEFLPHYDDEMLEFLVSALFAIQSVAGWRLSLRGSSEPVLSAGKEVQPFR